MPDRVVLDANVAIAWYVRQASDLTRYAVDVKKALAESRATLCVPPIWDYEVGSTLVRLHRNPAVGFSAAALEFALRSLEQAEIEVHHVAPSFADVARLALKYQLSGYDAVYLETARVLGAPLASFDKPLRAACRQQRVSVYRAD